VAQATPNSVRAERHLSSALQELEASGGSLTLETIDVFVHPRRAMMDGVIATPTLIAAGPAGRSMMVGDLSDTPRLRLLLQTVIVDTAPR
jgi:hypothetical protein